MITSGAKIGSRSGVALTMCLGSCRGRIVKYFEASCRDRCEKDTTLFRRVDSGAINKDGAIVTCWRWILRRDRPPLLRRLRSPQTGIGISLH